MILGMNGAAGDIGGGGGQASPQHGSEIDAALRDLNRCVDRIHALIPRLNAVIEHRQVSAPRRRMIPRVIYGGGPSAFASTGSSSNAGTRHGDHPPTARQVPAARMGSSGQLLVAADLALAGYSRDQIAARLSARRDPDAASAIDEAFE